jgi:hypothetical protein
MVTHVPMYFVPKVVATAARFFWMPLSAVLVPFFVAASTGSVILSLLIVSVWELVRAAITLALVGLCDSNTGLQSSDAPYCTGNFPFDYPHSSVINEASAEYESELSQLSPAASNMGQFWFGRLFVTLAAVATGILASYVRARLIHNQRKLMFFIPAIHGAQHKKLVQDAAAAAAAASHKHKNKGGGGGGGGGGDDTSSQSVSSSSSSDEDGGDNVATVHTKNGKKHIRGAEVQEMGYDGKPQNTNINRAEALEAYANFDAGRVAPLFDLTLGMDCGHPQVRSLLLCCAPSNYHVEQQGMGIDLAKDAKKDPVLDHMNYLWLLSWVFVITGLEIVYEVLPMLYNRYTDESHNAMWLYRAILGSSVFGILLTSFGLYMYFFVVYPLSTAARRNDLRDNGQHAGAFSNLNAEWVTNYLLIVMPIIVHVCLVSWTLVPALGAGVLDDINYAPKLMGVDDGSRPTAWRSHLQSSRMLEAIFPIISLFVIAVWTMAVWCFKDSRDTKNAKFYNDGNTLYAPN